MNLRKIIIALMTVMIWSCSNDDDVNKQIVLTSSFDTDSVGEDVGRVTISFTLNRAVEQDLHIDFQLNGTADENIDYSIEDTSVLLDAGETSVNITLNILDDNEVENSESLSLTITSVQGSLDIIVPEIAVGILIMDNDSFPFENGYWILNEGNFFQGNASLSFVDNNLLNIDNEVFHLVNDRPLGDVAQSVFFWEDKAFIIVNNSQKIEVVNRYSLESIATINTGLQNPRYMEVLNGVGVVTNWGDGSNPDDDFLAFIDLENLIVSSTVSVAEGPERILSTENFAVVAHQGGFGQNDKVSIITSSETVTELIVGDVPNSMQFDTEGNLWILCGGKPAFTGEETAGRLVKVDVNSGTVLETLLFDQDEHPSMLNTYDTELYYYLNGSVFTQNINVQSLQRNEILNGVSFYDMNILNEKILGLDAKDFASPGELQVFSLQGVFQSTFITDNIPGEIYFNPSFPR